MHHSSSTSNVQYSAPSGPSNFGETSNLSAGPATTSQRDGLPGVAAPAIEGGLIWLECSPNEKYLLVEDMETGDVLMPLFYLKDVLKVNYSRKLANLNHRLVEKPPLVDFGVHEAAKHLYWLWTFESPQNIKTIVRRTLGTACAASGHLRLVLLPVIYNTMQSKEELRATPLFAALRRALKRSAYLPLLQPPPAGAGGGASAGSSSGDLPAPPQASRQSDDATGDEVESLNQEGALFGGPKSYAATAAKYMSPFKDLAAKRVKMEEAPQPAAAPAEAPQPLVGDLIEELRACKRQCAEHACQIAKLQEELAETRTMTYYHLKMLHERQIPRTDFDRQRREQRSGSAETFTSLLSEPPPPRTASRGWEVPPVQDSPQHLQPQFTTPTQPNLALRDLSHGFKQDLGRPGASACLPRASSCLPHTAHAPVLFASGFADHPNAAINAQLLNLPGQPPVLPHVPHHMMGGLPSRETPAHHGMFCTPLAASVQANAGFPNMMDTLDGLPGQQQ